MLSVLPLLPRLAGVIRTCHFCSDFTAYGQRSVFEVQDDTLRVVEVATGVQTDGTRHPTWNPVLFQPEDGPLMLYYKVGPNPREWWGMRMVSHDDGRSWSEPERLPDGILGPVKNKPVQLPNGDLLSASSTEHDGWRVHFERSTDGGATWVATPPVNDGERIAAIQPSVLLHPDGRLQAIGRTRQDRLFTVESSDGGHSWGEMTLLELPNPSSGTDALTLADGRHLLVYNHTSSADGDDDRSTLNVALSRDGRNWEAALVLENTPGEEFSYPAVIQTGDGLVHITYTWHRTRVRHVVLDPSQLILELTVRDGTPADSGQWPHDGYPCCFRFPRSSQTKLWV